MKVVFGTTNVRKIKDFQQVIEQMHLDIELLSLDDIGWDQKTIAEIGTTIEEISLFKAKEIFSFLEKKKLRYPVITDDAGLFCDALQGRPGIYTARYAEQEFSQDPTLPSYQGVLKLLDELSYVTNRRATYQCCITCMMSDGMYFQKNGQTKGTIANSIIGNLTKPYFYSVFIVDEYHKLFCDLTRQELLNTYRYMAFMEVLDVLTNGNR